MFYLITVAGGTLLVTFFNFIFSEIHTFRTFGEILLSAVIGAPFERCYSFSLLKNLSRSLLKSRPFDFFECVIV